MTTKKARSSKDDLKRTKSSLGWSKEAKSKEEILKEFDKRFQFSFNVGVIPDVITKIEIRKFLSQALDQHAQSVREETKKETIGTVPKTSRKGQTIFNFLQWVRVRNGGNNIQSLRMADPFYIEDGEWDNLFMNFLSSRSD